MIDINKHNIVENDTADTTIDTGDVKKVNKEELSEKDQQELEELEKQADTLEEVLEENKNLNN